MSDELQYEVPEGQDHAIVVSALTTAGYETRFEEIASRRIVSIECPNGERNDRGEVRQVIASTPSMIDAGVPMAGQVVFEDEKPG